MTHQRRTCCGGTRPSQNWLVLSVKLFHKIKKKNLSWKFCLMLGEKQALWLWSSWSMSASGKDTPRCANSFTVCPTLYCNTRKLNPGMHFFFKNICRCDGKGCLLKYKRGFCLDGTPRWPPGHNLESAWDADGRLQQPPEPLREPQTQATAPRGVIRAAGWLFPRSRDAMAADDSTSLRLWGEISALDIRTRRHRQHGDSCCGSLGSLWTRG